MRWYLCSYVRRTWRVLVCYAVLMALLHLVLSLSSPLRDAWADIAYLDLMLVLAAGAFWVYGLFSYRSRFRALVQAQRDGQPLLPAIQPQARDEDIRLMQRMLQAEARRYDERLNQLQFELGEQRDGLSRWAHEVKTPLSVMELVLERAEAAPVRNAMLRQLARIRAQVAQVLHIERLQALGHSLDMRELDMRTLVKEAVSRAAPLLRARSLAVDVGDLEVPAMGDAQCVSYVLDQLLGNAAKYAQEDSEVRLGAQVSDGRAGLWVANQGERIPERDLRRVFDKGFSGERRVEAKSSGMGLYYAKKTSEALGGTLTVTSDAQQTRFTLWLPLFHGYLEPVKRDAGE